MKAYGLDRLRSGDADTRAAATNGRATSLTSPVGRAFRSVRGGRKARARRKFKRAARLAGKLACHDE